MIFNVGKGAQVAKEELQRHRQWAQVSARPRRQTEVVTLTHPTGPPQASLSRFLSRPWRACTDHGRVNSAGVQVLKCATKGGDRRLKKTNRRSTCEISVHRNEKEKLNRQW